MRIWIGVAFAVVAAGVFVGMVSGRHDMPAATIGTVQVESQANAPPRDALRYQVPVTSTQPSLGPPHAPVTMVVWCDLRGDACRAADAALKAIMRDNDGTLRWVHRHLLDTSDAEALLINHVAHGMHERAGKFWEFREKLLATPDGTHLGLPELRAMAEATGADWAPIAADLGREGYAKHIQADLNFAKMFGVTAAPGIIVNGRPLPEDPHQSLEQRLRSLVAEERAHAEQLIAGGVAPRDVYTELTRDALWSVNDDPAKRRAAQALR
jgi:protein-disulfide isomerase